MREGRSNEHDLGDRRFAVGVAEELMVEVSGEGPLAAQQPRIFRA